MKNTILFIWLLVYGSVFGLRADINGDCRVDIEDLCILCSEWMQEDEDCIMGLGPELVTNGDFDSDVGWNAVGSAIVNFGFGMFSGVGTLTRPISVTAGKMYQVVFEIASRTNGDVRIIMGGTNGTSRSTVATFTETIIAAATTEVIVEGNGTLNVNDLSVKEILGGSVISGAEFMDEIKEW